jgi:hypothetical protein
VDGNSPDGTSEVFRRVATACAKVPIVVTERPGGKGRNVLEFLEYCREQDVGAMAMIDADVQSITPAWVEALLDPVVAGGVDWVSPLYLRSRFDAATTAHFAYPFVSAVTGLNIRQPIGGDFGFSVRFARSLRRRRGPPSIEGYGIDIFMTLHAGTGGFRLAQVALGRKAHKPSFPRQGRIFREVVSTAVASRRSLAPRPVQLEALPCGIDECPTIAPAGDRFEGLLRMARADAEALAPVYLGWLGPDHAGLSAALAQVPHLSAEAWADILAAALTSRSVGGRSLATGSLADQLYPLYTIRSATLWRESQGRPAETVEAEIVDQARHFRERLEYRLGLTRGRPQRHRPASGQR